MQWFLIALIYHPIILCLWLVLRDVLLIWCHVLWLGIKEFILACKWVRVKGVQFLWIESTNGQKSGETFVLSSSVINRRLCRRIWQNKGDPLFIILRTSSAATNTALPPPQDWTINYTAPERDWADNVEHIACLMARIEVLFSGCKTCVCISGSKWFQEGR